jgi:hypothetical protein
VLDPLKGAPFLFEGVVFGKVEPEFANSYDQFGFL